MGVAIRGYSRVRRASDNEGRAAGVYINEDFPEHADGLTSGTYGYDRRVEGPSIAYSSYNTLRKMMCRAVHGVEPEDVWNSETYRGTPLYELIHFSDCEGTIGPKTSAKIHADLVANRDRFIAESKEDVGFDWRWIGLYDQLIAAFEAASDDGLVVFH